jgi:hypothetical protein
MAQVLGSVLPRLGRALGTGIAQPIEQGLDALAQKKMAQLQQQQYTQASAPFFGKEAAGLLAVLSPKEREIALQNMGALEKLLAARKVEGAGQQSGLGALASNQGIPVGGGDDQGALGALQPPKQADQPEISDASKAIQELFTSPHTRREEEKLDIKKQQLEREMSKDVRQYLSPYDEQDEESEKNIADYQQIIKHADDPKLISGYQRRFLNVFGMENLFDNPVTEITGKYNARLAQNIKGVFGTNARITNFLEQTFQRSLPSLWNTPEGMKSVAILNMARDEGNLIKNNIRREIIEKNNWKIPNDINAQVRKRTQPQLDKIQEEAIDKVDTLIGDVKINYEDLKAIPDRGVVLHKGQKMQKLNGKLGPYRGKKF